MKKDEFLKSLQARLVERGLPEASAEKETAHVRTYLAESSMDEVDISIDEMAEGILSMLEDNSENEHEDIEIAPVPMVSEEPDESVSDELSAAIAAIDSESAPKEDEASPEKIEEEKKPEPVFIPIVIEPEAEEAVEVPAEEAVQEETATEEISEPIPEEAQEEAVQPEAEEESAPAQEESEPEPDEAIAPVRVEPEPNPVPEKEEKAEKPEPTEPEPKPAEQPSGGEEDENIEEYIPYNQKVKMKKIQNSKKGGNEWLYVLLLVVTIPLSVALILTAFVVYLGFWVVLALAMIACIAALVVFVTVFALIAIVGIVYGVVQLITGNMPVGLFEIGLGVMVGAAVMFIGILVYNFAVRFIPFIMKLLARLFHAGFRGIKNGYHMLKGAVEEL